MSEKKDSGIGPLIINTGVNVSKLNAYVVLDHPIGVDVTKLNAYAVLTDPYGVKVSKSNYYAVLAEPPYVKVSKVNYYAVIAFGPGDVLAATLVETSTLVQQSFRGTETLAPTLDGAASISITGIVNFSVTETLAPALLGTASTTEGGGGPGPGVKGNKMIYHF